MEYIRLLCLHCTTGTNGIKQSMKVAPIRHNSHPLASDEGTSRHAHHTPLARHGLGDRLEELTDGSSTRDNKDDMVPGPP